MVLLVVLTACTGTPERDPPPDPGFRATFKDQVEVEEAVEEFLAAFAEGREDPGHLLGTVAGDRLRDWARWINRHRPEREAVRDGRVEVASIRVVEIGAGRARAVVDATVVQETVTEDGEPAEVDRRFNGPVLLLREGSGWRVADLVRDGSPMSHAIAVFEDPPGAGRAGVRVEVRSVYRFLSGTVATLRIENDTDRRVVVDRRHSLIQAAGRWVGATGSTLEVGMAIPPGSAVEGSLAYHTIPIRWLPERVVVHFRRGPPPVAVDLPRASFLPR
jgi:hypothetical protein